MPTSPDPLRACEMVLEEGGPADVAPAARFETRRFEELPFDPEPAGFERVRAISEELERAYAQWVSPLVRMTVTPASAQLLRTLHPMRSSRQIWSERTMPALALLPWTLQCLEQAGARDPERASNPWYRWERSNADAWEQALESWRTSRDFWVETVFEQLYAK